MLLPFPATVDLLVLSTAQTSDRSTVHRRLMLSGPECVPVEADVIESGTGRPVVFLHGLVGLNEHWEGVVRQVEHRCRCVMLELPLLDLEGDDCSIDGVTRLTTDFLANHFDPGAGPWGRGVVLVGNSFGGHVALRIALESPELVDALVLAGSSGLIEKTFVRGAPVRPSRDWIEEKIGELFHDKSKMAPGDVDRAHKVLSSRKGARAMVRLSKTARRNNLGVQIRGITQPTLLIWGREDVVTPPSAAEGFAELLPNSELVWLDECGHAPMLERPDEFTEALLRFLDRLDAAAEPDAESPPA